MIQANQGFKFIRTLLHNFFPKQINRPLFLILGFSIGVHLIGGVIFGGLTIHKWIKAPEQGFKAPPLQHKITPKTVEYKLKVQKRQKSSNRPRPQHIAVTPLSSINIPSLNIQLPEVENRVALGNLDFDEIGTGLSFNTLGFGASAVNFFGIESQGERIIFIVDARKNLLKDDKGGLHAYRIIKEEITKRVGQLSSETLFNILLYENRKIELFRPQMVSATRQNKQKVAEWIQPINEDPKRLGVRNANYKLKDPIDPISSVITNGWHAVNVGMEMQADTLFIITDRWNSSATKNIRIPQKEYERRLQKAGWTKEREIERKRAYAEAEKKAKLWLSEESKRRQSRGLPPRIVEIKTILHELGLDNALPPDKPKPYDRTHYSFKKLMQHIKAVAEKQYPHGKRNGKPSVNIILFLGKDEKIPKADLEKIETLTKDNNGSYRVLRGLKAIKNLTGY